MKQNGSSSGADNGLNLNFDAIKQLVDLVQNSKIGRIKICQNGFEVEVEAAKAQVKGLAFEGQPVESGFAKELVDQPSSEEVFQESGNKVVSPIVGTFYSSPAPGKPAFVQEGSLVKKGDVLFIIESMKLMNEIKSEFEGRVKKIYIKTGEPVEFGQLIMIIE